MIRFDPHFWLWSNHLPPLRTVLWDAKGSGWTTPQRWVRCTASAKALTAVSPSGPNKTGCWPPWLDALKCGRTRPKLFDKISMTTSPSRLKTHPEDEQFEPLPESCRQHRRTPTINWTHRQYNLHPHLWHHPRISSRSPYPRIVLVRSSLLLMKVRSGPDVGITDHKSEDKEVFPRHAS